MRITCFKGFVLNRNNFNGDCLATSAADALGGTLPGMTPIGIGINQSITPGTKVIMAQQADVNATTADNPGPGFWGGIFEVTIEAEEPVTPIAGINFAFVVAACLPATVLTTVDGVPVATDPANFPGCGAPLNDSPWLGHARGDWSNSGINAPMPPGESLVASGNQDDIVEFTIAQAVCEPYGGDVLLYPGNVSQNPKTRANKGLYGISQKYSIPLVNGSGGQANVSGFIARLNDLKFFAGIKKYSGDPTGMRICKLGPGGNLLGQALEVFNVTLEQDEVKTATFDLMVAGASTLPVGPHRHRGKILEGCFARYWTVQD